MKAKLVINTKSTSAKINDAVKAATKLNGKIVDNLMIVESNELNQDFIKLLQQVIGLKKVELSIDDNAVLDLRTFFETITCKRLKSCNGNCTMDNGRWKFIFMPLGVNGKQEQQFVGESTFFSYKYDLVKEIHSKHLIIDRDVLIEAYTKDFENQRNYCPKYRDSDAIEKVKDLPAEIEVKLGEYGDHDSPIGIDLDEIIKKREEEQNDYDEKLIIKVGEEVEKRMRIILDEYFSKNQNK